MTGERGRLCASINARTVPEAAAAARALPAQVELAELRADLLAPEEIASGAWRALAGRRGPEWVFTWRSPAEGGAYPRARGILEAAVEAGFPWIDVEARELEDNVTDALAVPFERRWVSRHLPEPPAEAPEVLEAWSALRRHPGALHKLVVAADRFEVTEWVLEVGLEARRAGAGASSIFAQGWPGHLSRILGHLQGNAVTFVADAPGGGTAAGQPDVATVLEVYDLLHLPPEPRLFGVLGMPVRRSRSAELHNHAFRLCGERALYVPLEAPDPEAVIRWVRDGRLRGISVTAPYKERVARMVDELEPAARSLGAVNTVWNEGGRIVGTNTDVVAAREMLVRLGATRGDPLAVLGAGGAAAAVLGAAREEGLEAVVFNRDPARGERTAARFGAAWGGPPAALAPGRFRIVVNATPVGVDVPVPETLVEADWGGAAILDLAYGAGETGWAKLAGARGLAFGDGLEFLARQGLAQQRRWCRRRLDLDVFARGLRR